jgi:PhoH-like ATPase
MDRPVFVLDTSVLINNPKVYDHYPASDVILPVAVLTELDKLKKGFNDSARNARVAIRYLDEICDKGDITTGILLENDCLVKIDAEDHEILRGMGPADYGDSQILACAYANWLENKDLILLTNDINLRVKAKSKGIHAEEHKSEHRDFNEVYTGVQDVIDEDAGGELICNNEINPNDFNLQLNPHEFVNFLDLNGDIISSGRLVSPDKIKIVKRLYPWNLKPRNHEQILAIDLLMDCSVPLVSLCGKTGSGKSLLCLAACLDLVFNKKEYDKLVIYRPFQSVGKTLGFLPGLEGEKLAPWFQAIMDSLEVLFSMKGSNFKQTVEMWQEKGKLEFGNIEHCRGRTFSANTLVLLDECQNLPKDQVKTIISRMGEGRIVLTGDLQQIDAEELSAIDNGIVAVIDAFKPSYLGGSINLVKCERSALADAAADLL